MPYEKVGWQNNQEPALSGPNLDQMDEGIDDATAAIEAHVTDARHPPDPATGSPGEFVKINPAGTAFVFGTPPSGGAVAAPDVSYDPLVSGLSANNVKAALDELADEKADEAATTSALNALSTGKADVGDLPIGRLGPWSYAGYVQAAGALAQTPADFVLQPRTVSHLRIRAGQIPPSGNGTLTVTLYKNGASIGTASIVSGASHPNNTVTAAVDNTGGAANIADGDELRAVITSAGTGATDPARFGFVSATAILAPVG